MMGLTMNVINTALVGTPFEDIPSINITIPNPEIINPKLNPRNPTP